MTRSTLFDRISIRYVLAIMGFAALSFAATAQVLPGAPATTIFTPSKNVSNNSGTSWFQQMAIDQKGNINLVWLDNSLGYWAAFFSRSIDGGLTFSNPQNLSNDVGGSPNMAVDAAGTIYVVWTAATREAFLTRSSDGINFSPPMKISDNMGALSIALGPNGSIYLGWDDGSPYRNVFFSRSNDGGGTFSSPVLLSTVLPFGSTPLIAVDSSDNIDVAWQDDFGGDTHIWFSRSSDGGATFSESSEVPGTIDSRSLGMALDSSGDINVIFSTVPFGNVFLARSTDGGSSFTLTNVSNNINRPYYITPGNAQMALDSRDNIDVVWDDSLGGIFFSRSTDQGTSFSSNAIIPSGATRNAVPQLTLDSSGNINLVWRGSSVSSYDVFFSRSTTDAGTTFSTPQKLSNNTVTSSPLPQIALDFLGNPYVAWMDYSPGNPEIFFSRGVVQIPPVLPKNVPSLP
jgi:hypothetical protein